MNLKVIRELPHRVMSLPHRVMSQIRARLHPDSPSDSKAVKGTGLLRLHEYQHKVLVDIFHTSIAGFFAFALILLAFTLHTLIDSHSPRWIAYLMGALSVLLILGLARTVKEFRIYRANYEEITLQLKAKLMQQAARQGAAEGQGAKIRGAEPRLLATLKPKEYRGWDAKTCKGCGRPIELLASVCPSCGQDQENLLAN
jgi:hypothetical protein